MRLFGRGKQRADRQDREAAEVKARLNNLRQRLTQETELAGLFTLTETDSRPGTAAAMPERREPPRVWPAEVPSSDDPEHARVTYGDWELMRPPGPFTVR